jgi:hypothetical protein
LRWPTTECRTSLAGRCAGRSCTQSTNRHSGIAGSRAWVFEKTLMLPRCGKEFFSRRVPALPWEEREAIHVLRSEYGRDSGGSSWKFSVKSERLREGLIQTCNRQCVRAFWAYLQSGFVSGT